MYKPEATLELIKERGYGAKAMERRIKRCCADNPDCAHKAECVLLYDRFIDSTDASKSNINIPARRNIYHQLRDLGVGSVEARANMSAKRVRELNDNLSPPF